jgi:hypothetical protein
MGDPQGADGRLPEIYRSREAFFASLPAWRRFLSKLNWRPTIDLMVKQYALEQLETPLSERVSSEPKESSSRNAIKATLLLLLGIGIMMLLFSSPWFWLLLMVATAAYVAFGLLAFLWQAIYDTFQEEALTPPR